MSRDHRDLRVCQQTLRIGSKSFYAASLLLPKRIREPVAAMYAFCRVADDAVDLDPAKHRAVACLRQRIA